MLPAVRELSQPRVSHAVVGVFDFELPRQIPLVVILGGRIPRLLAMQHAGVGRIDRPLHRLGVVQSSQDLERTVVGYGMLSHSNSGKAGSVPAGPI